jgi:hypothetical protein
VCNTAGELNRCARPQAEGADCDGTTKICDVAQGVQCNQQTKKCEKGKLAAPGEACGMDPVTKIVTLCRGTLFGCSATSMGMGTCKAAAPTGGKCSSDLECVLGDECTNGACVEPAFTFTDCK